jgi:hypothetical protein
LAFLVVSSIVDPAPVGSETFIQDPDPDTDIEKIIPNPDPGSSGFEKDFEVKSF